MKILYQKELLFLLLKRRSDIYINEIQSNIDYNLNDNFNDNKVELSEKTQILIL